MNKETREMIPDFLSPGTRTVIGTHTFYTEDILRFGKQFDPQKFHTDPIAARQSMLGELCASGWHTVSIWMKLQRKSVEENVARLKTAGLPYPEFGPSPGMKDLRWKKPVFANDTITYANTAKDIHPSRSRSGWWVFRNFSEGINQNEETVIEFESTVFITIKGL